LGPADKKIGFSAQFGGRGDPFSLQEHMFIPWQAAVFADRRNPTRVEFRLEPLFHKK
jgi:hypothetical protein